VGVAVKGARRNPWSLQDSLEELAQLARTAGALVVERVIQRLDHPSPMYLGEGKLEELAQLKPQLSYTLAIFDDELSPSQQKTLEQRLKVKIIDRTALILDIFAKHARTHEGRLQVELAQHEYLLPRLAGQWAHLERLGGGIGTRGPGEQQLETDRRIIRDKIARLKRQLEEVRGHRALHRAQRKRAGIPVVSLVGYTNAGKSTLMNALSGAQTLVEDKLFATLDPTTRAIFVPKRGRILLTDTVGFIQKLPPTLVAAFRATLEELEEADLLLHVVDLSHPKAPEQAEAVEVVLQDLGIAHKPCLAVLNKIDLITGPEGEPLDEATLIEQFAGQIRAAGESVVLVSAAKGWGLDRLRRLIGQMLPQQAPPKGGHRARQWPMQAY
jgi:GTP-binding protein HflX